MQTHNRGNRRGSVKPFKYPSDPRNPWGDPFVDGDHSFDENWEYRNSSTVITSSLKRLELVSEGEVSSMELKERVKENVARKGDSFLKHVNLINELATIHFLQDVLHFICREDPPPGLEREDIRLCRRMMRSIAAEYEILPRHLYLKNVNFSFDDPVVTGGKTRVYRDTLAINPSTDHVRKGLPKYERNVALKRYAINLFSEVKEQVHQEILYWQHFDHPNLLPFLGLVEYQGMPVIVTAWQDNGTIIEYLRNGNIEGDILSMLIDVAAAIQYLHDFEPPLAHGDIKGANILVDRKHVIKVSDFGLISEVTSPIRGMSSRWAPPELWQDIKQCQRKLEMDIWSLGMATLEILTLQEPYFGDEDLDAGVKIMKCILPAKPPVDVVSDQIWNLLIRCWSQSLTYRPKISTVVAELQNIKKRSQDHSHQTEAKSLQVDYNTKSQKLSKNLQDLPPISQEADRLKSDYMPWVSAPLTELPQNELDRLLNPTTVQSISPRGGYAVSLPVTAVPQSEIDRLLNPAISYPHHDPYIITTPNRAPLHESIPLNYEGVAGASSSLRFPQLSSSAESPSPGIFRDDSPFETNESLIVDTQISGKEADSNCPVISSIMMEPPIDHSQRSIPMTTLEFPARRSDMQDSKVAAAEGTAEIYQQIEDESPPNELRTSIVNEAQSLDSLSMSQNAVATTSEQNRDAAVSDRGSIFDGWSRISPKGTLPHLIPIPPSCVPDIIPLPDSSPEAPKRSIPTRDKEIDAVPNHCVSNRSDSDTITVEEDLNAVVYISLQELKTWKSISDLIRKLSPEDMQLGAKDFYSQARIAQVTYLGLRSFVANASTKVFDRGTKFRGDQRGWFKTSGQFLGLAIKHRCLLVMGPSDRTLEGLLRLSAGSSVNISTTSQIHLFAEGVFNVIPKDNIRGFTTEQLKIILYGKDAAGVLDINEWREDPLLYSR